jgi:hypothetical protein
MVLREKVWAVDWSHMAQDGRTVANSCAHDNKVWTSIKDETMY